MVDRPGGPDLLGGGDETREGQGRRERGPRARTNAVPHRPRLPRLRADHLVLVIDLVGTALFAAEGASTASAAHLDLLGGLVLAFATAVGGGIVRDLLIGDAPPSAIRDWRYAATILVTGAPVFLLHLSAHGVGSWLLTTLDAAGLGFFAVSGATKALEFRIHPLLAVMMGGITGVGGGTLRDLLINQIPTVLRSEIYAVAAMAGATVAVVLLRMRLRPSVATGAGIVLCFVVRMLAVFFHWQLPGGVR